MGLQFEQGFQQTNLGELSKTENGKSRSKRYEGRSTSFEWIEPVTSTKRKINIFSARLKNAIMLKKDPILMGKTARATFWRAFAPVISTGTEMQVWLAHYMSECNSGFYIRSLGMCILQVFIP